MKRREFLQQTTAMAAGITIGGANLMASGQEHDGPHDALAFKISLAEWSLHRELRSDKLDNLDFAKTARDDFDIEAIEYVSQFFQDKAKDTGYLEQLNQRAADHGVKQLLIMIDGEGALGDSDQAKQTEAIENHYRWVEAAKTLGCHSIRVNAQSSGSYDEQLERAADGLARLTEFAQQHDMNVIVENHGGLSSNGAWLAAVIKKVDLPNCGTLPDFGNFRISGEEFYDRYQGVTELMPFAKAVSAKSHDFDEQGNEVDTDFSRMMKIVLDHGYHGYVGIEYEGGRLSERDGVTATKKLLERVRSELSPS